MARSINATNQTLFVLADVMRLTADRVGLEQVTPLVALLLSAEAPNEKLALKSEITAYQRRLAQYYYLRARSEEISGDKLRAGKFYQAMMRRLAGGKDSEEGPEQRPGEGRQG